jgi:hypothetical protein
MSTHKNCEGLSRRDTLQLGLGLLGCGGLANLLRLQAEASDATPFAPRKKTSCILIWMDGGPSHFETFDPKPEAPLEIRGDFEAIDTKMPGVQFSQYMTRLAAISDKFATIRSVCHNQANHGAGNHYMMTGAPPRMPVGCGAFVSFHPSLGSVAAYECGAPNGLPPYFSMPSMSRSGGPNFLGAKYAPFVVSDDPNNPNFRVRDVALPSGLADGRFLGRRELRVQVDRMQRIADKAAGDPVNTVDDYYRQGYNLVTSVEAQRAFDVQSEPEKIREAYGRNGFGQRALLARRLVEAGVPFVTLYEGGWDHHSDIFGGIAKRMPAFENTIATLIEDLEARGKLDTTMVVALGEFGRTPKISTLQGQSKPGRDHWSSAMSILFAGCGTPGGQVIGATDRNGYAARDRVLSPENFVSTIYRKLGIDPGKIYHTPQGRPVTLVTDATPISELMA